MRGCVATYDTRSGDDIRTAPQSHGWDHVSPKCKNSDGRNDNKRAGTNVSQKSMIFFQLGYLTKTKNFFYYTSYACIFMYIMSFLLFADALKPCCIYFISVCFLVISKNLNLKVDMRA